MRKMAFTNPVFVITPPDESPNTSYEVKINEEDPDANARKMNKIKYVGTIFLNLFFVATLCALIIILEYDLIPFKKLGFACNDPALSHRYRGDTIHFGYLLLVAIVVPLVAMLIVELLVIKPHVSYISSRRIKVKQVLFWYGQFFLGVLVLMFITQTLKSIVAAPRPHFFDTCRPDTGINCTSGYIETYKCTNNLPKTDLRDSYKSFPSGHSALGMFTAIVVAWYLQNRVPSYDIIVVPWLQCICITWGFLCSLTRLTDRRHHWWDVLGGIILAALVAILTVKVFCEDFQLWKSIKAEANDNGNIINREQNRKHLPSTASSYSKSEQKDSEKLNEE